MYECFHCLQRALVWQADYSFEDYGIYEEEGIVHTLKCSNCGADVEYYVPVKKPEDEDGETRHNCPTLY